MTRHERLMRIDHLLHAADKMKLDTATIRENLRRSPHHEDTEFNNDLVGVENQLIQSFTFGQLSLNAADKWLVDALDDYGRRNVKAEVNPCACGKETIADFEEMISKK